MLDPVRFTSKPKKIAVINNRIIEHPESLDVETLANQIVNGKTFIPSLLEPDEFGEIKRSRQYWKSQQVIALDFDNEVNKTKHITITLEDALHNSFIKEYAAFIYTTFSHTESHPKFRVVFILDNPIYTYEEFESIINELIHNKFKGTVDKQCSDGTRLFFGGKELLPINYNNRLPNNPTLWADIQGIKYIYPPKGSKDNLLTFKTNKYINNYSNNGIQSNVPNNIQFIKDMDIQQLQNAINPKPIVLYNNHQVYEYLKQQDLHLFLGVNTNNIYDIFHDESSPSASIYRSNEGNGHWLYKCHSTSKPFTGTIIQIVEKLLGCSMVNAKDFLMKVYKIDLKENEAQKQLRNEIDAYKYMLQSDELLDLYPNFSKLFGRYGFIDNLYILLDLVKENLPADSDDPRLLFYHSINTLAEKFGISKTVTGIRMNFFTFFKLIHKLDESEIPNHIKEFQKRNKRRNQHKYRNSTYELKIYSYDFFNDLDEQCLEWMEKGLTTKSMNYEGLLRSFGREEADRVFPQDKGKEINSLNDDVVFLIETNALNLISDKGWATEKEILENVELRFRGQKAFKESQLKRCIAEMLDKYGLKRIKSNKKVKEELEITEEQLPKSSFPVLIIKI